MVTHEFTPSWNGPCTTFSNTWSEICNVDQFRWLSRADVLNQLKQARYELGVKHVRAVAMYSPELVTWDYDLKDWKKTSSEKQRRANWQMVDLTIEGLLEIGVKPIYTTCFTPMGMTDDQTNCWPDRNPTGLPRDLKEWQEFVSGGILHQISRYGIEEVSSWYFECWNEPNLQGCFFGGTKSDFFRLWSATWQAVKSVDSSLRFGGPSTARGEWLPEFLDFTREDGTPPDYLITHIYNNDSESQPSSPFDGTEAHRVKDSPHFASGVIKGVHAELERRNWKGEIHWNEWGRSWFVHDPLKETPLEAAFIAKTMAEVSQCADQFSFWCLSDIYNQAGFQSSEFQGHYGMLSLHGLRKQSWFAHMLLSMLGHNRFDCEGGNDLTNVVATQTGRSLRILVYAYPERVDDLSEVLTVKIAIPNLVQKFRLIRLGLSDNNIVSTWRRMGSPAYPTPAQLAELQNENDLLSAPSDAVRVSKQDNQSFAEFTIERPGVALLLSE